MSLDQELCVFNDIIKLTPTAPLTFTHQIEVHNLENPYRERQVDDDCDHEKQEEDVQTALTPAVDANLVDDLGPRPIPSIGPPTAHHQLELCIFMNINYAHEY